MIHHCDPQWCWTIPHVNAVQTIVWKHFEASLADLAPGMLSGHSTVRKFFTLIYFSGKPKQFLKKSFQKSYFSSLVIFKDKRKIGPRAPLSSSEECLIVRQIPKASIL